MRSHLMLCHVSTRTLLSALHDLRILTPILQDFSRRYPEGFVPPVFHSGSAMAHTTSSYQDIASRNLTIPIAKFSDLFLRDSDTRSLIRIQQSSYDPDPMIIHLLASRVIVTLSTQYLGPHPANSQVREITDLCHLSSSDGRLLAFSPLRRFMT
jgi:hypothetical protein